MATVDLLYTVKNVDTAIIEPAAVKNGYTGTTPDGQPETVTEFRQRHFLENYVRVYWLPAAVEVLSEQALNDYKATQAAIRAQIENTVTVEIE